MQTAELNREKQGRKWLAWSFIICPCHLPLSMAALGIVFGAIYAVGLSIGFRHIRAATKDIDCTGDECVVPT